MKRSGVNLTNLINTKKKTDHQTATDQANRQSQQNHANPYMKRPCNPEDAIRTFLVQSRTDARKNVPKGTAFPITKAFCEVEARIGILKSTYGLHDRRVISSGPKRMPQHSSNSSSNKSAVAHAFLMESSNSSNSATAAVMESGITRSHFVQWTSAGLSEASPISQSFAVTNKDAIRHDIAEQEMVETVYGGYHDHYRVCFPGNVSHSNSSSSSSRKGKRENKEKLCTMDIALPSALYDLRLTLSTERVTESQLSEPPRGWKTRRIKRRRSYTRKSFAWQLDVTEVTTCQADVTTGQIMPDSTQVMFELELELKPAKTLELINCHNHTEANRLCQTLAKQLWWMLTQINPLSDVLDVEEFLRPHPDKHASQLALAQCAAIKRFHDSRYQTASSWESPIAPSGDSPSPPVSMTNTYFPGCMPVNFSRHNIEDVQRKDENGYFLSEKTDGVRYFMVFTGTSVVLVDRAMKTKQPIPRTNTNTSSTTTTTTAAAADPMAHVIPLIKQGAVLDGEVVMHRKLRRPIFIVFDVLTLSANQPILHHTFAKRKQSLDRAEFQTTHKTTVFDKAHIFNPNIALPLVKKNFVKRLDLDAQLLRHVTEEKGMRCYKYEDSHHHLTDGIIFQPNLPYVCGTDHNLLKWKYLDTVTIDVEILPPSHHHHHHHHNDKHSDEDPLRVGVLGDEGTSVDMTKYVKLPPSERRRLEADRHENGAKIAEVGFEPTTGEWYYLTMRPDKIKPNHISTVLGTLLELAESLSTEELQYRMSVPPGGNDTWRKQTRKMQRQLLDHQRQENNNNNKSRNHHHHHHKQHQQQRHHQRR